MNRVQSGKTITHVAKSVLIFWRDALNGMIENYVDYEYGDWKKDDDNKDYKYKDEWEEILKGNDYY